MISSACLAHYYIGMHGARADRSDQTLFAVCCLLFALHCLCGLRYCVSLAYVFMPVVASDGDKKTYWVCSSFRPSFRPSFLCVHMTLHCTHAAPLLLYFAVLS